MHGTTRRVVWVVCQAPAIVIPVTDCDWRIYQLVHFRGAEQQGPHGVYIASLARPAQLHVIFER